MFTVYTFKRDGSVKGMYTYDTFGEVRKSLPSGLEWLLLNDSDNDNGFTVWKGAVKVAVVVNNEL